MYSWKHKTYYNMANYNTMFILSLNHTKGLLLKDRISFVVIDLKIYYGVSSNNDTSNVLRGYLLQ